MGDLGILDFPLKENVGEMRRRKWFGCGWMRLVRGLGCVKGVMYVGGG